MELRFTNQTEEKTLRAACTVKDDCIIEGPPGLRRDLTEREMKESARDLKLPVSRHSLGLEGSGPCLPCHHSVSLHAATILFNPADKTSTLN
ncbi:hypothetical protein C355_06281 [Cryptococcus neoformans Th84]|nr:hypothetical protein C355_06281 [Cryptococcus neoformans var. grubii Th84]OXH45384.1 hypothetical protein J002_06259 [Cryptococcus neoformans var. grubii]OXH64461.1 hypothetical protein J000_06258 [Cryptococcus neoformans var. grubii]